MIISSPSVNQRGLIRLSGFQTKAPTFFNPFTAQQTYLGFGASQNLNNIYFRKSDLIGLTPSSNNTAESLLAGIINQILETVANKRSEATVAYWGAVGEDGTITKTVEIKFYNLLSIIDYEIQYNSVISPMDY
jgi:hypothetical protein